MTHNFRKMTQSEVDNVVKVFYPNQIYFKCEVCGIHGRHCDYMVYLRGCTWVIYSEFEWKARPNKEWHSGLMTCKDKLIEDIIK